MQPKVLVIISAGGIGLAVARRLGSGRRIVLGDCSEEVLQNAVATLKATGYEASGTVMDVSEYTSVFEFAQSAANEGDLEIVVHAAGVSPVQASPERIYKVDLLGTANVIDVFKELAVPGMSLTCIASGMGHLANPSAELARHFATAPRASLLDHPELNIDKPGNQAGGLAYQHSKKGNQLRVQAAAYDYGLKGARINSISPGFIMTAMGAAEAAGEFGPILDKFLKTSPAKRAGTPDDIARAVAFLSSPESSFITGTDLLVDGGGLSTKIWHNP